MGTNKEVFMDTRVFTDIVKDIGGAASACILSNEPLAKADFLDDSDVGKELHFLLKEAYEMTELHRKEASESLPRALSKLRDSMIAVDDALSKSLTVSKCASIGVKSASAGQTSSSDARKAEQKHIYDTLKKRYGFSDKEMEYLEKNNNGLLISLYGASKYSSADAEKLYNKAKNILQRRDANKKKIDDDYSRKIIMPNSGEKVEVSLGVDHIPPRQSAVVASEDTWSIEYTIKNANTQYPPERYRSTRALNHVLKEYKTNMGEDDNVLIADIGSYGPCYVGAMVTGFGNIGDIVQVTLDDGTKFNMVLCDTKDIHHEEKALMPKAEGAQWQCQNYWGHGYMTSDQSKVQMCACEFVAAGDQDKGSAKNYSNANSLLAHRHVVEAEIIGTVDMPD